MSRDKDQASTAGMGNLFTTMGRMNCGISLAGRKN